MRIAIILYTLVAQACVCGAFVMPKRTSRTIRQSALFPTSTVRTSKDISLFMAKKPPKKEDLALAGKLMSTISKLFMGPAKAKEVGQAIWKAVHVGDLLLIAAFSLATMPIARFLYSRRHTEEQMEKFDRSNTYRFSRLVSQAARISAVVYAVDLLEIFLNAIGMNSWYKWNVSKSVAQVLYTIFFTSKLMAFKQRLLCQLVKVNDPEDLGPAAVYDRIADLLLVVVSGLIVLDMLAVQTGVALQSFFALGGVGTLVLSLGSRDLAAQFVSSLALTATGKFHEGELISLGDNTSGVVTKMGWMHTELRGGDDIIVKIPNVQLASQRVSNISRMRRSQVQQTLWFSYDDIKKLPAVISDIKAEIRESCPRLIVDGSRPFRVHWRDFKNDHLEVVVDTHFYLPPTGNVYWDNRQAVLMAIASAADKNGVKFDSPNLTIKTRGHVNIQRNDLLESLETRAKMHDAMSNENEIFDE